MGMVRKGRNKKNGKKEGGGPWDKGEVRTGTTSGRARHLRAGKAFSILPSMEINNLTSFLVEDQVSINASMYFQ